MRAVFIGCVHFSEAMLRTLLASRAVDVVGVITREQSSFNADFASLAGLADEHGIPFMFDRGNDQESMCNWVRKLCPDVIFCVGWPYLLKAQILNLPPRGVIGYHPSDVPSNRGRHPIIWALALGLSETASTFFQMSAEPDAGAILDKVKVLIDPQDDAAALYATLLAAAQLQIVRIARALATGTLDPQPQDLTRGNVWRKRSKRDGLIDWRMSSQSIYNLVRALARPYPGAHCEFAGSEIKIWGVRPLASDFSNLEPGKILRMTEGYLTVKTGDGAVQILEHEFVVLPAVGSYL